MAATDVHQPKRVVMKPEDLEKMADRLYGQSMKVISNRKKEFDDAVTYKASHNDTKYRNHGEVSESEEKALHRLYTQPIERKRANREKQERIAEDQASVGNKKIQPEEAEQLADRLYAQSMRQKQQSLINSTKRIYGDENAEQKKLSKADFAASVDSLFTTAVQKKKDADEKLTAKYRWKQQQLKPLTKEETAALADRLSTKK
jgi:hypothetical protein